VYNVKALIIHLLTQGFKTILMGMKITSTTTASTNTEQIVFKKKLLLLSRSRFFSK